jgi:molecular chaperone DnaK (HSP70)
MAAGSKYIVGIDLGTTNTVVSYAEHDAAAANIGIFDIEQLVALGEVAPRPYLPSLRYHPAAGELDDKDLQLPWLHNGRVSEMPAVIGALARELGAQVPGRLVASAKSWLSHPSVDRTAAVLPWGAPAEVTKISPVDASASYLDYVRHAWNHRFPDHPLETQDLVLTVPASFDEGARALTVDAAQRAGLPHARLLEEPQAAFYDWLFRHRGTLHTALAGARLVLVCDVGGGTTDLTLIRIAAGENGPTLTRIGVGDHLMLGGDNMDLGLAHIAEGRLATAGAKLGAAQMSQLIQQCRTAKERLLAPQAPENMTVTVLGAGARLIGGARSTVLSRDEVAAMVVDGFFPEVPPDDRPRRVRGGIVEFGLPYVADPAVTRHVAAFLQLHAQAVREALSERAPTAGHTAVPDAVLLNGGVFRSAALAGRLVEVLSVWRGAPVHRLYNDNPDAAVARGAVAYGLARLGGAPKIGGGSARSYFLVLDDKNKQGVCVLPKGSDEGQEVPLHERSFALRLGQPVRFHLLSSTADRTYRAGELASLDQAGFISLPPIATVIKTERESRVGEMPVRLAAMLTEVGTLEMHCISDEPPHRRWKLEFQLRTAAAPAVTGVSAEIHPRFTEAAELIDRIYGGRSRQVGPKDVKQLLNALEKVLGKREAWDTPLLRELFGALWERGKRRRRSADHERLWFNLAGFCMRPGFGFPLDDWRVEQLWSLYDEGVQFIPESQVWSEWWTLWRRVAGGLDEAAQIHIVDDIAFYLQPAGKAKKPAGPKKRGYDDMVRLAAALERIPVARKIEVGEWLLERLRKPKESATTWWAVGRIAARDPFYGSAHNVVPAAVAAAWLQQILGIDWKGNEPAAFAAAVIARKTGDRERDIGDQLRGQITGKLQAAKAPLGWIAMVSDIVQLDEIDERRVFGDSLPPGLKLVH